MIACLSPCKKYRYRLEREVAESGGTVAFFGVNPSTADADVDDQTTKKWKVFARQCGARRYLAGNVFAYRATDVNQLAVQHDPRGPENDEYLDAIIADADILLPCWGSRAKLPPALRGRPIDLLEKLIRSGKPVMCFGTTNSGDPKHPLMLGYDTPIVPMPFHRVSLL